MLTYKVYAKAGDKTIGLFQINAENASDAINAIHRSIPIMPPKYSRVNKIIAVLLDPAAALKGHKFLTERII